MRQPLQTSPWYVPGWARATCEGLIPRVGAGVGSCLPDSLWDGISGAGMGRKKGFLGYPSPTVGSCESSWRTYKPLFASTWDQNPFPKSRRGSLGMGWLGIWLFFPT